MARRILLAYVVVLALLALLPLSGTSPGTGRAWVAPIPFATILAALGRGMTLATVVSVAGNVVAFVPLGLLAPTAAPGVRTWPRVLALGFGVSLAIELAQLAIGLAAGYPYRMTDVDDVILNTAGAALGYGLHRFAISRRSAPPARTG